MCRFWTEGWNFVEPELLIILSFLPDIKKPAKTAGSFMSGAHGRIIQRIHALLPAGGLRPFKIAPCDFVEPELLIILSFLPDIKKPAKTAGSFMSGAHGRIRTSDRLVRSQVLYPAELHARISSFSF